MKEEIKIRLEKAKEKLEAAKYLLKGGFYDDAISRAYYAVFHAAKAILLLFNEDPKTHEGVLHKFGLRIIKEGILDKKYGVILRRLKEMRETSDYVILAYFTEDEIKEAIRAAEEFIHVIEDFLKKKKIL